MRVLRKARLRLRSVLQHTRVEHELESELAFHLEEQVAENIASGMTPAEARRTAIESVGSLTRYKEECRDMRRVNFIENLRQDLRFGVRTLRLCPAFTTVAVLTVALGIGANTAIFSVVYAALLRPLPYAEPDRLITIGEVRQQQQLPGRLTGASWNASYPDFLDWRSQSKVFESMAGFTGDGFTMRGLGEAEVALATQVTPNFFHMLGVRPAMGRDFHEGEDAADGPHACIVTYGFWKTRLGGDRKAIGRALQLDSKMVTVVGVLPPDFEFAPAAGAPIWVPLHIDQDMQSRRNLRWMSVVGRLARGARPAQANAEMKLINARLAAEHPQENGSVGLVIAPLRDRIVGNIQPLLLVLFGAAGFVLLIACANVASLLMARAAGRRREFAVRAALGAGRRRLIAQLLSESLLLAGAGAALGLAIARFGTGLLIAAIPQPLLDTVPFLRDAGANPVVLAFLCGAALFTAVAFGIWPALDTSNRNAGERLKEDGRSTSGGGRTRLRHALVVAQIGFSVVLLASAGLMMKSLDALLHRDPGFNPRGLLTFSVNLPPESYSQSGDALRFDREFTARVRALPDVSGIASSSIIPLTGGGNTIRFVAEGRPMAPGQDLESDIRTVSSSYLATMGIPLVAGRFFNDSADTRAAPRHVVVNQTWAKRFFPGENPVGKRIRFTNRVTQPFREIVGVIGDIADTGLDSADDAILFTPYLQGVSTFITYLARSVGEPSHAISEIRAALRETDAQLILIQPTPMERLIAQSPAVFMRKYPSLLIGSFAMLAIILAAVGLYGVISYSVSQRMRELGIRIALGARPVHVVGLVLGEGAWLAVIGVTAGLAAALGLTRLMRSLLFGVSAADPTTFAAAVALLATVAMAACYIPARRAIRADPLKVLRSE